MIIHARSSGRQTQNGHIVTVGSTRRRSPATATKEINVPRYSVETIEAMQKHLLGYRDNLGVEVEPGIRLSQGPWLNFARSPLGRAVGFGRPHRPRSRVQRDDGRASAMIWRRR